MKTFTKQDERMAKKYPLLASRAKRDERTPSEQSIYEQSIASAEYDSSISYKGSISSIDHYGNRMF